MSTFIALGIDVSKAKLDCALALGSKFRTKANERCVCAVQEFPEMRLNQEATLYLQEEPVVAT